MREHSTIRRMRFVISNLKARRSSPRTVHSHPRHEKKPFPAGLHPFADRSSAVARHCYARQSAFRMSLAPRLHSNELPGNSLERALDADTSSWLVVRDAASLLRSLTWKTPKHAQFHHRSTQRAHAAIREPLPASRPLAFEQ